MQFKISFAYSHFGDFDGLVVVLNSGDNVIIICQLNSEISDFIVFYRLLEGKLLVAFSQQHINFGNENNVAGTKS